MGEVLTVSAFIIVPCLAAIGIVKAVRPFVLELMRERTRQVQAEAQPSGELIEPHKNMDQQYKQWCAAVRQVAVAQRRT
ncbi:MAG: hypothetical protein CL878_06035 [Dehalococcoidia bacterium]|nr:hypothetical protein [Dehalococcoidia bacterium]